jgi:hypothetical protein
MTTPWPAPDGSGDSAGSAGAWVRAPAWQGSREPTERDDGAGRRGGTGPHANPAPIHALTFTRLCFAGALDAGEAIQSLFMTVSPWIASSLRASQ